MFDLNALRIFVKVVENEGFTAAADKLDMPKSKVSRVVSKLENDLKTRLLERTTRQIRLTESGRLFYQYAQRIANEAEQAEISIQKMSEQASGLLRISTSLSVGQYLLRPKLSNFLNTYPDIQIDLEMSNRRVDLIEENFDVAIRIGTLANSSLVSRRIGTTQSHLYASNDFIDEHGVPAKPSELETFKVLYMSDAHNNDQFNLINNNNDQQKVTISHPVKVNDFGTLLKLAQDSIGIAMLPQFMCTQEQHLVRVLPDWHSRSVPLYVLYPSHRGATPKLRAFINFLNDEITPQLTQS